MHIILTGSLGHIGQPPTQELVLHAHNASRAQVAQANAPGVEAVVIGDLSSLAGMGQVVKQANDLGRFDAIIHIAGMDYQKPCRGNTANGLPVVFTVNSLAPYVLYCLL